MTSERLNTYRLDTYVTMFDIGYTNALMYQLTRHLKHSILAGTPSKPVETFHTFFDNYTNIQHVNQLLILNKVEDKHSYSCIQVTFTGKTGKAIQTTEFTRVLSARYSCKRIFFIVTQSFYVKGSSNSISIHTVKGTLFPFLR